MTGQIDSIVLVKWIAYYVLAVRSSLKDESDAERGRSHVKHRPGLIVCWLPWFRKIYDFYDAPVVKFWAHSVSVLPRT